MALPSSGAITLNDVNIELGRTSGSAINLGDAGVRSLAGVSSGAIGLSNLYGKVHRIEGTNYVDGETSVVTGDYSGLSGGSTIYGGFGGFWYESVSQANDAGGRISFGAKFLCLGRTDLSKNKMRVRVGVAYGALDGDQNFIPSIAGGKYFQLIMYNYGYANSETITPDIAYVNNIRTGVEIILTATLNGNTKDNVGFRLIASIGGTFLQGYTSTGVFRPSYIITEFYK